MHSELARKPVAVRTESQIIRIFVIRLVLFVINADVLRQQAKQMQEIAGYRAEVLL